MIKLNNKNITYVALADSNNSLKAPKEIWYADSNNSVKLVYRRKDALIEGEDYEKYHWLVGDGTAYINTQIPTSKIVDYDITFQDLLALTYQEGIFGARKNASEENLSIMTFTLQGTTGTTSEKLCFDFGDYIQNRVEIVDDFNEHRAKWNGAELFVDGVKLADRSFISQSSRNALLFKVFNYGGDSAFHGKIANLTISGKCNIIPCKLLKPVPKWLDANGIRRQVGECGMIDLVSGKFYGNVNSVGTFTVENYYERKEWLQGRNGAYINTNYYPVVGTDIFSVHFRYDGTLRNPDGMEQDVFGERDLNNNYIRAYINSLNYLSCNYYHYEEDSRWPSTSKNSTEWILENLRLDESLFKYTANEVDYSYSNNNMQLQESDTSMYLFNCNNLGINYFHGDINSFKITTSSNTKMNLIPCTLTMDLPASMDANNIARTKGTSGMWDLVSDKFYGNVANSGTFKAVNLAEGVDYEVHQWLKGDGTAYINTLQFINADDELRCSIIPITANLSNWQYVYGNNSGDNAYTFMCVLMSSNRLHFRHKRGTINYSVNTRYNIVHSINSAEVNGDSIPYSTEDVYVETDRVLVLFNAHAQDNNYIFDGYIGNVILSSKLNLIPVKLLRSIPSKYDANGIARQAGECGMYDTVNDVFYGNVASSGTFSVSDDS